ncbi:MAG: fatty acid desaturase, partial [Planctomycetota bacterium]
MNAPLHPSPASVRGANKTSDVDSSNQHAANSPDQFSFKQARALVHDLRRPKPWIYWTDFLVSILVGHIAIHVVFVLLHRDPLPALQGINVTTVYDSTWMWIPVVLAYVVTVLCYLRSIMFIHEIVHIPKEKFRVFRIVWNMLCGVFLFVPSFTYYPHVDHHRRKHYGTDHDGEYLPLAGGKISMIFAYFGSILVLPFLGLFRFAVLSPICWLVPGARTLVHRHMSSLVIDPFYRRDDGSPQVMRMVVLQEVFCFAWCVWFLVRGAIMRDELIDPFWFVALAVSYGLIFMNHLRALGSHRW